MNMADCAKDNVVVNVQPEAEAPAQPEVAAPEAQAAQHEPEVEKPKATNCWLWTGIVCFLLAAVVLVVAVVLDRPNSLQLASAQADAAKAIRSASGHPEAPELTGVRDDLTAGGPKNVITTDGMSEFQFDEDVRDDNAGASGGRGRILRKFRKAPTEEDIPKVKVFHWISVRDLLTFKLFYIKEASRVMQPRKPKAVLRRDIEIRDEGQYVPTGMQETDEPQEAPRRNPPARGVSFWQATKNLCSGWKGLRIPLLLSCVFYALLIFGTISVLPSKEAQESPEEQEAPAAEV